ncbi:hypothetical protein A3I41_05530 [Candidatus Uhrbacteria bacterium RIFCSPLOWO2_02_FULL_48_18]|uniref:YbaK/aminoacyl-tRNA synthetase-associated domain-containing protein n=1 Tax=Candidatus Uhrbacteria bacterium RIFCSPLOWO2_02_FULL_48_18 TaxID=1802408 RepID=A0A1F7V8E3_9BACT|nr:MAG: hypothetical protein A3I41_05530 [Candidatus Uhrbacteria bacterium RIFCSPLOWO2_02_FULL_48_18]OGL94126.1 MAG: hypothetical protein A3H12_00870 [Candidatus Uhrbacteria bacterium RIFCSPLOWO2_12_FULL_47_9]
MTDVYQKIISRLDAASIEYHTAHHEPTLTSADASRVRGIDMHSGAKAIVTKGHKTGTHYLFVMPADLKLDNAKAKAATGEGVGFASDPFEVTGCVPGSVPPFGSLFNIKTFCDPRLAENERIFFNAGSLTDSLDMRFEDYITIEQPILIEIGKVPTQQPLDKLEE